tara:strand:- start:38118 stop:38429 length:312 start_codon:yes stop_codon:yes gene_type:complete
MSKRMYPLGDSVGVRMDSKPESNSNGIIYTQKEHRFYRTALVVSVGPGTPNERGVVPSVEFKEGDRVIFDAREVKGGFGEFSGVAIINRQCIIAVIGKDVDIS